MLPTRHKKARVCWQYLVVGVVMLGSLGLASSQAYGWGSGTHNYVADVLGSTQGSSNYQEMYGAMALDTFNFRFDPYSVYLADLLHTDAAMQVWNRAQVAGPKALPVAYGFMSHNNVWGADSTAHINGLTYGQKIGYVIAKAKDLQALYPLPPFLGVPLEVELLMDHLVVESAVDVLLKQVDPGLGQKIRIAALVRPPEFPTLLVDAFADDLVTFSQGTDHPFTPAQAAAFIYLSEGAARKTLWKYGLALDAEHPVPWLALQLAGIAEAYLGSLPLSKAKLTVLLSYYIFGAMNICGDFNAEIAATTVFVDQQLQLHGVTYTTPLPATVLLFGLGLAGMGLFRLKAHLKR